ncbi:MAG: hypothetical protein ACKOTZ_09000 [Chloroflexota bacterium]
MTIRTGRGVAAAVALATAAILALALALPASAARELTLTTRNLVRAVHDIPSTGPSTGDIVTVAGVLFGEDGTRVGRFDLVAVVTDLQLGREMRMTTIELDWDDSDDAILIEGAEDYPAGGGLPTDELVWAISGGTGAYATARGEARITYDTATERFTLRLALAD